MCGSMADIRRGKKQEEEEERRKSNKQDKNIMSACGMQGGHNKWLWMTKLANLTQIHAT